VIRGTVESSVVSPGVTVERDAVVRNSVVFADSVVGEGALVNLSIIDKEVVVGERAKLGYGVDFCPNNEHPALMNTGLTLVEKGSIIPAGSVIGRNCQVLRRDRGREPVKVESGHNLA
jgi:glucose-1-phosphate adenylyltransferase